MNKCLVLFVTLLVAGLMQARTPRVDVPLPAELTDTKPFDADAWTKCARPYNSAWGSTDVHYSRKDVPTKFVSDKRTVELKAWKGERVNAMALLWSTAPADSVVPVISNLRGPKGVVIPSDAVEVGFLHYVMTDQVNPDGWTACGDRHDHSQFDSSMVADVIDTRRFTSIQPLSTQPVWVSIDVPRNIPAGTYHGSLSWEGAPFRTLDISVKVGNRVMPEASERRFWLDLWQHPYSVARYYNVPLWSNEHFDAMRDTFEPLAAAGQKCITVPVVHKPWGGQTEDHFESMVGRVRELDGSWTFNYDVFDQWVEFMQSLGINSEINCYSLIPWRLSFRYYDRASDSMQFVTAEVGTDEYNDFWMPFLKDFAKHLKSKGWFDKTTIAMDERSMDAMVKAIRLLRAADPDYKVALAGGWHPEIQADINDYCISLGSGSFPSEVLATRRAKGQHSTVYTCCAEAYPNTFTCSSPAEATWLPWYAAAANFDGYLRWAYSSWVKEPLQDTRFRTWAAGDCFFIYPGGRSSVRLEKLNEGIQDFEKIAILRDELKDDANAMTRLNELLTGFDRASLPENPAANWLPARRAALNDF